MLYCDTKSRDLTHFSKILKFVYEKHMSVQCAKDPKSDNNHHEETIPRKCMPKRGQGT